MQSEDEGLSRDEWNTIMRLCLEWSGRSEREYTPADYIESIAERDGWYQLLWLEGITMIGVVDVINKRWQLEPTEID